MGGIRAIERLDGERLGVASTIAASFMLPLGCFLLAPEQFTGGIGENATWNDEDPTCNGIHIYTISDKDYVKTLVVHIHILEEMLLVLPIERQEGAALASANNYSQALLAF